MPKTTDPLDAKDLDEVTAGGCDAGCGHAHGELYLAAKCHPGAGVGAVYKNGSGELRIECHECGAPVVTVRVSR